MLITDPKTDLAIYYCFGQLRLSTGLTQRLPSSLSDFQRRSVMLRSLAPKGSLASLAIAQTRATAHSFAATSIAAEDLDYPRPPRTQALFSQTLDAEFFFLGPRFGVLIYIL